MSGICRGCFRHLHASYGSDLCPRCEERAEYEAEDKPPDTDRLPYGELGGDVSAWGLK